MDRTDFAILHEYDGRWIFNHAATYRRHRDTYQRWNSGQWDLLLLRSSRIQRQRLHRSIHWRTFHNQFRRNHDDREQPSKRRMEPAARRIANPGGLLRVPHHDIRSI